MSAAEWVLVATAALASAIDTFLWLSGDRKDGAGLRAALWASACIVLVVGS